MDDVQKLAQGMELVVKGCLELTEAIRRLEKRVTTIEQSLADEEDDDDTGMELYGDGEDQISTDSAMYRD